MYDIDYFEGEGIPFILGETGKHLKKKASYIIKERPKEIQEVYNIINFIMNLVWEEGLLALEENFHNFSESHIPQIDFFLNFILPVVDGVERNILLEMIANEFLVRKPSDFELLVLFLYTITILSVREWSHYDLLNHREEARKALIEIKNKYLIFLPKECREVFEFCK